MELMPSLKALRIDLLAQFLNDFAFLGVAALVPGRLLHDLGQTIREFLALLAKRSAGIRWE